MKVFFRLFLLFMVGQISALSANFSASPQNPAFLDSFNDQQKKAIRTFLHQELGISTAEQDDKALVNGDDLKQLYGKHLENLHAKVGAKPSNKNENKTCRTCNAYEKIQGIDCIAQNRLDNIQPFHAKAGEANLGCVSITADDIGDHGYVIIRPGHYCLQTNKGVLRWNPQQIADLITIDADNVILDLNDTTIIHRGSSNVASSAVKILPGHKNIVLLNGSLTGFTADAISGTFANNLFIENFLISNNKNRQAYTPSSSFASINIQASFNVTLRDITISKTEVNSSVNAFLSAGILVASTQTFLIENCKVVEASLEANTVSQCVGISTFLSSNGVIRNCRVSNCQSEGIMPGFGYVVCQNILTEGCIANYNTGTQTTSGYYPQFSDSLQFINCEANSNQSTCQDCHGFPYFISSNGFISNCRALNNIAENPTGGFNEKMTGFEILICNNCVVENCEAFNNRGTNLIRHYAAGFANGNTTNVIFRNCTSIGNSGTGNFSRGVGFGPALDPRFFASCTGTIWENCIAEANFGDIESIGFDLFGQIGAILTGSISQNHGIVLLNLGTGIKSDGAYDEGNPVDVPCDVVPIIMITQNTEKNVIVKDNIVANNSFAGIVDTTNANNVYINNTVFNNGTNFIGPIFTEGTPIRNWNVKSAPSDENNNGVTGDKLDNENINPS